MTGGGGHLTEFSHPKPRRSQEWTLIDRETNGADCPCLPSRMRKANSVNFIPHPCQGATERRVSGWHIMTGDSLHASLPSYCCRSAPPSLRWVNADPPSGGESTSHIPACARRDCLSLQWQQAHWVKQTHASHLTFWNSSSSYTQGVTYEVVTQHFNV